MEREILGVVSEMLESRNHVFSRSSVLNGNRDAVTAHVLNTENSILALLSALILSRRPLTISFPMDAFNEPVIVTPTPQQINNEIVNLTSDSQQTCSICQESIADDGCQLRGCNHPYHRHCIRTWFSASVRCPICRRDIREGLSNQTSSESQ
jgi:hypothetical protein